MPKTQPAAGFVQASEIWRRRSNQRSKKPFYLNLSSLTCSTTMMPFLWCSCRSLSAPKPMSRTLPFRSWTGRFLPSSWNSITRDVGKEISCSHCFDEQRNLWQLYSSSDVSLLTAQRSRCEKTITQAFVLDWLCCCLWISVSDLLQRNCLGSIWWTYSDKIRQRRRHGNFEILHHRFLTMPSQRNEYNYIGKSNQKLEKKVASWSSDDVRNLAPDAYSCVIKSVAPNYCRTRAFETQC